MTKILELYKIMQNPSLAARQLDINLNLSREEALKLGPEYFNYHITLSNMSYIANFTERTDREISVEEVDGITFLILALQNKAAMIPDSLLEKIAEQSKVTGQAHTCFEYARQACLNQQFTGRIMSNNVDPRFYPLSPHCINWHLFRGRGGGVVAFDLTTRGTIDRNGYFDVLMLMEFGSLKLFKTVGDLYGGEWE